MTYHLRLIIENDSERYVITLASAVSEASFSAIQRTWSNWERLKSVAVEHHLIKGINIGSALMVSNVEHS